MLTLSALVYSCILYDTSAGRKVRWGEVSGDAQFEVTVAGEPLINLRLDQIRDTWAGSLAEVLGG